MMAFLPCGMICFRTLRAGSRGGFHFPGRFAALSLVFLLGFPGCDDGGTAPEDELSGGVVATFDVEGERFHVWVTSLSTIDQLFDLQAGGSMANIPIGPLLPGPGKGDHNLPWSWHMDPSETEMAENTIEVCSGRPSYVEDNLQYWLALGSYCPWAAELVELEDHRQD